MILVVMRIPPDAGGHGGSQRAFYLLEGLSKLGPVDFVLIHRKVDKDCVETPLEPILDRVKSARKILIEEWDPIWIRYKSVLMLPWRIRGWADMLRIRSFEAPRLSGRQLRRIAKQLPAKEYDLVFAGRLPSAAVVDSLIDRGLLKAKHKVVDFDDIMSRFRQREIDARGSHEGWAWRKIQEYDVRAMKAAEKSVANSWDAVSLCNDEDVGIVQQIAPEGRILKVPNVISRPMLPERVADGTLKILFVGSLGHPPNVQGLEWFFKESWQRVRDALPNATLSVVGMFPTDHMRALLKQHGAELHANVPSVEPYYADADMLISPILFGGGTRIKILEAMAYGRPVVSTTIGAEGLDMVPGEHGMIADTPADFADAIVTLARDPEKRRALAAAGRALQEQTFGPAAIEKALEGMLAGASAAAR